MSSVQLMAEKNARLNNEKTPKCKMLGPSKSEHHFGMAQYSTPKSNLSDSGSMNTVNESIITNPFENRSIVDSLLQPSCSPSVNFSTSNSCLNKSPGSFWTIDQIAVLNPADIDLSKLHEQENFVKLDADSEIKAQRAIDDFFASTINITSPFSLPDKPHYVAIISPSPSMKRTTNLSQKRSESASKRVPSKIVEEEVPDVEVRHKITTSTQTALTIPADVDLGQVLAKYYTFKDLNDSQTDSLCNSSLRRKLFFQENNDDEEDDDMLYEIADKNADASPEHHDCGEKTPNFKPRSRVTPSTCQSHFSSSPVVGGRMHDLGTPDAKFNPRGRKLMLDSPSPLANEDSIDTYKSCYDTSPPLHSIDLDITPLKDSPDPHDNSIFVFPNNNQDNHQLKHHNDPLCISSNLSPIKLPEVKSLQN